MDGNLSTVPAEGVRPIESIERELTTLAGHINAGNYRFLVLLGEFDARKGFAGVGLGLARSG